MAGSISLSLSQQFNSLGKPLAGGKLYLYQGNTLTPQNAYKDTGLTLAHANPITLDSAGRVPEFYLADGTIHVRLTDKNGVVQIDAQNVLVIGPSSGGGGGGSAVDPSTIFQTGDTMWLDVSSVRSGWVRDNGRTIGSATSGGTERANADCQNLFNFLWNTYADAICPVLTGRGASAALDWAANKQITLPDKRGYLPAGLADMGNSNTGAYGGVTFSLQAITAGGRGGEVMHTLTTTELAAHNHGGTATDSGHTHNNVFNDAQHRHNLVMGNTAGAGANFQRAVDAVITNQDDFQFTGASITNASATANISLSIANAGSSAAHNNTPLVVFGTFYRKL